MGGKTSAASKNKWAAKAYDRIVITVPKGDKDKYKQIADASGQSLNAWIVDAMEAKAAKTSE